MASWLDRLFGSSKTREHYEREADRSAHTFVNHEIDKDPDFVDAAGGLETEDYPHGFSGSSNIEFLDLEGESECVDWITFDHTPGPTYGDCLIQFLEHGKPGRLYRYKGLDRQDILDIDDGVGPFPFLRNPLYYQKDESPGQNVNYHLRNDQQDDGHHRTSGSEFTYEHIG